MKKPDSPDCVCTSGDSISFSPNRAFVVETFTMLISQKQTLVSSDTSCAVGKRERPFFFFSSPSVLVPCLALIFSFLFLSTSSANFVWSPQSAEQTRLLQNPFFYQWRVFVYACSTRRPTWTLARLTVIYLLHSASRQAYRRLWKIFTNLCSESALMAVLSVSH